jgi:hypothetical protein
VIFKKRKHQGLAENENNNGRSKNKRSVPKHQWKADSCISKTFCVKYLKFCKIWYDMIIFILVLKIVARN